MWFCTTHEDHQRNILARLELCLRKAGVRWDGREGNSPSCSAVTLHNAEEISFQNQLWSALITGVRYHVNWRLCRVCGV